LTGDVSRASAYLFKPQTALRVRWDTNTDTPLPPDVPAGKNPPDGAVVDYLLGSIKGDVTLEVYDQNNQLVRKYSSSDPAPEVDPHLAIPKYWVRPAKTLSSGPGLHRFVWDMHYDRLPSQRSEYPMQAVFHDTAPAPNSPWVMPGTYTVKLTANGKTYSRPLVVKMDPRVKTPVPGLKQQFVLSKEIYDDLSASDRALDEMRKLRADIARRRTTGGGNTAAIEDFDKAISTLEGEEGRRGRNAPIGPETVSSVNSSLQNLMQSLQQADVQPTTQIVSAVADRRAALAKLLKNWNALKSQNASMIDTLATQAP
jgi:hypothetical protein